MLPRWLQWLQTSWFLQVGEWSIGTRHCQHKFLSFRFGRKTFPEKLDFSYPFISSEKRTFAKKKSHGHRTWSNHVSFPWAGPQIKSKCVAKKNVEMVLFVNNIYSVSYLPSQSSLAASGQWKPEGHCKSLKQSGYRQRLKKIFLQVNCPWWWSNFYLIKMTNFLL